LAVAVAEAPMARLSVVGVVPLQVTLLDPLQLRV
jgi:hypothetical protein